MHFLVALLLACTPADPEADPAEVCDNLRDDDGDTLIDCADPDCVGSCPENCVDALDNDGDGDVDCADPECDGLCPEDCTDDRDNDGDQQVDCNDSDCLGFCPEDCTDGVDNDGDGLFDCVDPDCADPSCPELCSDGADNDGDGLVDCDDPSCDGSCPERCEDARDNDGDGATDCEDPDCDGGCPEACLDGRDNDGDGVLDCADPDCLTGCDRDGDGQLDAAGGGRDCDDDDPLVNVFAQEVCNGIDDDCDGRLDTDDPTLDTATLQVFFADVDGDGFGDTATFELACVGAAGTVGLGGDCDDGDASRSPGAPEVCDRVDNDCDGLVDDADPGIDPAGQLIWFEDVDGDGFGDPAAPVLACIPPPGVVGNDDDCNPFDPDVHEVRGWWPDGDGDGFGVGVAITACNGPVGYASADGDCNDADPVLHPDTPWYRDADLDGFGDPAASVRSCTPVPGHVHNDLDCDDNDLGAHPGASWAQDADGDGYGSSVVLVGCKPADGVHNSDDCDDADPWAFPGAPELCDEVDNDCDGAVDDEVELRRWYADLDGDGAGEAWAYVERCERPGGPALFPVLVPGDCDDRDASLNIADVDGDGIDTCEGDCDDFDPARHPGAVDAFGDGIDQDCSGTDGVAWKEGFEDGPLAAPWMAGGGRPWATDDRQVHSGGFSARSGNIWDGRFVVLRIDLEFPTGGELRFWRRLDADANDALEVFVDGVRERRWTGFVAWREISLPMSPGRHIVKFRYEKGSYGSAGADAAWIDDVTAVGGYPAP